MPRVQQHVCCACEKLRFALLSCSLSQLDCSGQCARDHLNAVLPVWTTDATHTGNVIITAAHHWRNQQFVLLPFLYFCTLFRLHVGESASRFKTFIAHLKQRVPLATVHNIIAMWSGKGMRWRRWPTGVEARQERRFLDQCKKRVSVAEGKMEEAGPATSHREGEPGRLTRL